MYKVCEDSDTIRWHVPALATVTFVYALVAAAAAAGRKSKVVGRKLVKKMFTAENILHSRKVFIHTPYVLDTQSLSLLPPP